MDNQPDALEQLFQGPLRLANLILVGCNVLIFGIMEVFGDTQNTAYMLRFGAGFAPFVINGEWYRLFTSMFLHFGFYHLFHNMVLLLFVGDLLEKQVGKWRYLVIAIGGGLLGNLVSTYMDLQSGNLNVSAGASGVVFAVIGGVIILLLLNPEELKIPVSRIIMVTILTILYGFQSTGVDNAAHIGGLLGGSLITAVVVAPFIRRRERKKKETS